MGYLPVDSGLIPIIYMVAHSHLEEVFSSNLCRQQALKRYVGITAIYIK